MTLSINRISFCVWWGLYGAEAALQRANDALFELGVAKLRVDRDRATPKKVVLV